MLVGKGAYFVGLERFKNVVQRHVFFIFFPPHFVFPQPVRLLNRLILWPFNRLAFRFTSWTADRALAARDRLHVVFLDVGDLVRFFHYYRSNDSIVRMAADVNQDGRTNVADMVTIFDIYADGGP